MDVIIGTAGHIDHGKTALVKALTGVETDRFPEEKLRGITIDIGFAELDLGDARIGFVDVPGHEKFVKNMLAGAIGIDQFASHLGSAQLRLILSIILLLVGGMLGGVAYTRWARAERAMRQEADLPLSFLLPFLALFTALLSVGLAWLIIAFG